MKKWLTFDLDGTLMQNPFVGWVFPEIVETIRKQLTEDKDIMKLIIDKHVMRMRNNQILKSYDWDDILIEVITDLNLSITIDVKELVVKHAIHPKVYALEDSLVGHLNQLEKKGYSLAVVTNGYSNYQFPVLKELGLHGVFDEIITPDKCGFAKPNGNILHSLINEGEIHGHVGDRIDHDIVMANTVGIHSIFINRNLPNDLKEIPVHERNRNESFLHLCKEKWVKEHNGDSVPFHEDCIPDIVISSIEELVSYLKTE